VLLVQIVDSIQYIQFKQSLMTSLSRWDCGASFLACFSFWIFVPRVFNYIIVPSKANCFRSNRFWSESIVRN